MFSSSLGLRIGSQAATKALFPFHHFDIFFLLPVVHAGKCSFDEAWLLSLRLTQWLVYHADVHSFAVAWPSLLLTQR